MKHIKNIKLDTLWVLCYTIKKMDEQCEIIYSTNIHKKTMMSYKTIYSFINKLHEKGVIEFERTGRIKKVKLINKDFFKKVIEVYEAII